MKIVYFGTPQFATYPLQDLMDAGHQILAVYSKEDKPQGRGQRTAPSSLKQFALEREIPVFTPHSLKMPGVLESLATWGADVFVVFAYGRLLPPAVLGLPKYGCINIHPSLLPLWRGASPVASAILNGDELTGVTVMQMDEGLDTGAILGQATLEISEEDTTLVLTDKLARLSGGLLCAVLKALPVGLAALPQDQTLATYSQKYEKEQGLLDFGLSAYELKRRVMAFNPWPSAYTHFRGEMFKILSATYAEDFPRENNPLGKVVIWGDAFGITTARGLLIPRIIQSPGRKPISAREYLNGAPGLVGAILGGT